jgi:hypothetical protein
MGETEVARPAIGAVTPADHLDGPSIGSAFAISEAFALTAFHVVGDPRTGMVRSPSVRVTFARDVHVDATVQRLDARADLALLRLASPPPPPFTPVPLGRAGDRLRHARFSCSGYPAGRPFVNDAVPVVGEVSEPLATIFDGVPAIALASDQAAGLPMHGLSGAPVLVQLDGATRDRVAIGVVRWMPVDPDREDSARGGLFYAAPASAAASWEEVRGAFVTPSRRPAPYDTAIRNFVHHYLGREGRPVAFGGRDAQLRLLDEWLGDDAAAAFMLLSAPAGRGKSALLVRWTERQQQAATRVAFVPVTIRWGLNSRDAVFGAIAGQLVDDTSGGDPVNSVAELLRQDCPEGQRLVVVLDGIDEAEGWDASPALFPHDLGRGVRVVVGARLTADRPTAGHWLSALDRSPRDAATFSLPLLTEQGIGEAVASLGGRVGVLAEDDAFLSVLHRVTEGDPLVLWLHLTDLQERQVDDPATAVALVEQRLPGLTDYLERWWHDQELLWRKDFGEHDVTVRVVYNVLACALGPLRVADVLEVARPLMAIDGDVAASARRTLRRLIVPDPSTGGDTLAHPRLVEHRRSRLTTTGELDQYDGLFAEWGRRVIADVAAGDAAPGCTSPYLLRHVVDHMVRAAAPVEDLLPVLSHAWQQAWEGVSEEHAGHLRDVRRVGALLAERNRVAVAEGQRPPMLVEQFRAAALVADVGRTSELLTPVLAANLLRHGHWSVARALALVRGQSSDWQRAEGLAAVLPLLPAEALPAARELFTQVAGADEWPLGLAAAELAAALRRHGQSDQALRLLQEQPPGYTHARMALRLLDGLAAPDRAQLLLRIPADVAAAYEQGELLRAITSTVDRALADRVFGSPGTAAAELLRAVPEHGRDPRDADGHVVWSQVHPERLAALAPWLPEETLRRVLFQVVGELEDSGGLFSVHPALEALAPLLPPELAARAAALTDRAVKYESWRTGILAPLLPKLDPEDRDTRIRWIVPRLAETLQRAGNRSDKRALSGALSAVGLLDAVLDVVSGLDRDDWSAGDYLTPLAPLLDEPQTRRALGLIGRLRPEVRSGATATVLGQLSSFSSATAREALRLAMTLTADPDEADAVRAVVAPSGGWVAAALKVSDPALRYAALATGAIHRQVSAQDLREAVRSFGRDLYRVNRLAAATYDVMLPAIPDHALTSSAVADATTDVIQTRVHEHKAEILTTFFARLEAIGARDHALALGARLSGRGFGFPMHVAVAGVASGASALDPDELHDLSELLWQVETPPAPLGTAALLRHYPEPEQDEAWSDLMDLLGATGMAQLYVGQFAFLVGLLPQRLRRRTIDGLFPPEFLMGESVPVTVDTWAPEVARLALVLDPDHLELLLSALPQVQSSSSRAQLIAGVAARFAALGSLERALDILGRSSGPALPAFVRMLHEAPDQLLPDVLRLIDRQDLGPGYRDDRCDAWALSARRLAALPPQAQWTVLEDWLGGDHAPGALPLDLLTVCQPVRALAGDDAWQRIVAELVPD